VVAGKYNCCGLRNRIGLRGSGGPTGKRKGQKKNSIDNEEVIDEREPGRRVDSRGHLGNPIFTGGKKYTEQIDLTFALIDYPVVRIRLHREKRSSTEGLRLGVRGGGPCSLEHTGKHVGYLVSVPRKAVPFRDYSQYEGNILASDTVRTDPYLDGSSGQLNRLRFFLFRDFHNHFLINKNPPLHKQEDP
jgi:hypothetical protein